MMLRSAIVAAGCLVVLAVQAASAMAAEAKPLHLTLRSRTSVPGSQQPEVKEKQTDWLGSETAIIICDVWDHHWCKGAEHRMAPLLPKMNAFAKEARARGALIIHAPSGTIAFYENTPQRAMAKNAPTVKLPEPLKNWNNLDLSVEGASPIDDSDGGCDCAVPCPQKPYPWTRQHPAIEIAAGDAITDRGQEVYNLLKGRGIRHVIIFGVHANMCILGRPFGIRQLTKWGFDTALARDLTDTMYNHRMKPFVAHEKGTELIVEHIEKYWCPTIVSSQVIAAN